MTNKKNGIGKLVEKLNDIRKEMKSVFLERDEEIDGLLCAMLAEEHVFLLGLPGTAKSLLTRVLQKAIVGSSRFEWLLGQTTTPEELFGPPDFKALKSEGVYRRVIEGKAPVADIVFLDEIWKCNSSVLNLLLALINERVFHNADKAVDCPLSTMVCASNELPQDDSLAALYDRIVLRYEVKDLADMDDWKTVVMAFDNPDIDATMTMEEIQTLQEAADHIGVGAEVTEMICDIRQTLNGVYPMSVRRWKKALKVIKARALLNGRDSVAPSDLKILCDIVWNDPSHRPDVRKRIMAVCSPLSLRIVEEMDAVEDVYKQYKSLDEADPTYHGQVSEYLGKVKASAKQLKEWSNDKRIDQDELGIALTRAASIHKEMMENVSDAMTL